jgi:uncharacterized Zn finger protein
VTVAVPSRESAEQKGRRYAAEGRLVVLQIDASSIRARCRGAGRIYSLGWTEANGWHCSCEARTRCAHVRALMLVTVRGEDG